VRPRTERSASEQEHPEACSPQNKHTGLPLKNNSAKPPFFLALFGEQALVKAQLPGAELHTNRFNQKNWTT